MDGDGKNFTAEADTGKGLRFPKWARVYVTYILPLIVLYIFVQGYWEKVFHPLLTGAGLLK